MGAWGTGLYSNDTTSDVRDTYLGLLDKQAGSQEAYEKTLDVYKELIGDSDEEPLFWFALAETQWRVGRLTPDVKEKALYWIDREGGMELWKESKKGADGWKKTLENLKIKLESEQRKEKRFPKHKVPFQNPWNLNDVYAYRIHKYSVEETERAVHGKYILMQKIGEGLDCYSTDTVMRAQIYERMFDTLPTYDVVVDTINGYRLLPLSNPLDQARRYKLRLKGKPDPFYAKDALCRYNPVIMSGKMVQYYKSLCYPKDELTYICTIEGQPNKQHERTDGDADGCFGWDDLHYKIGRQFSKWKDVKYDIIGDGTFEYPTLAQQEQIKDEINKV